VREELETIELTVYGKVRSEALDVGVDRENARRVQVLHGRDHAAAATCTLGIFLIPLRLAIFFSSGKALATMQRASWIENASVRDFVWR